MPIWLIIFLVILFTLFFSSVIAGFFFYFSFLNKQRIAKIEIMFFGVERQRFLELETLLNRLIKHKKAESFIQEVKQSYEKIKQKRSDLSNDVADLQNLIKIKKFDKNLFNESWNSYENLNQNIENFKNKINSIFEKIDLNMFQYKKIILGLPEADKIKNRRYQKFNTSHDIIDLKIQFVASKNMNLKESLNSDNFEKTQGALKDFKNEILNLYLLINDFVEIRSSLESTLPKMINKISESTKLKKRKYTSLENIGIEPLFQEIDRLYLIAQRHFAQGNSESTKDVIKKILIKIKIIEKKVQEEIYYSNFVSMNNEEILETVKKIDKIYKEIRTKIENYKNNHLIKNYINLSLYEDQLKRIYNNIIKEWENSKRQITKKSFALNYKEALFKIKHFLILTNQLEKKVFKLEQEKIYQTNILPRLEMTLLNLKVIIEDENIILNNENELLIQQATENLNSIIKNTTNFDDKILVNKKLLLVFQKQLANLIKNVGRDIEIRKVAKIIIQELNSQRIITKELNANLKLMESLILNGEYQKAFNEFIKYLKRRK